MLVTSEAEVIEATIPPAMDTENGRDNSPQTGSSPSLIAPHLSQMFRIRLSATAV
jgi:hypothetical protein